LCCGTVSGLLLGALLGWEGLQPYVFSAACHHTTCCCCPHRQTPSLLRLILSQARWVAPNINHPGRTFVFSGACLKYRCILLSLLLRLIPVTGEMGGTIINHPGSYHCLCRCLSLIPLHLTVTAASFAGEMGGTIINHPDSYLKAIRDIKASWRSPAALRAGVTFFGAFTPGQINRGPGETGRDGKEGRGTTGRDHWRGH
jgi:hypothetical protein